ncbi:MAG: hypothetical protein KDI28_10650 [Pseudomonadales bacterium]|nr:hypothetical protein [Pseudomonadales bacterium]
MRAGFFHPRLVWPLVGAMLLLAGVGRLQASTVMEMSFEEVVSHSALAFEGRVIGMESRQLSDGSIHTYVRFAVLDVIKGDYTDEEIELSFLGGQVGSRALQVSDMNMPEVGETGIYFVESLTRAQVHPLVGWAQGHFLLEQQSSGADIVTTVEHVPVVGIDAGAAPVTMNLSKGVAKGVTVRSSQSLLAPLSRPMSVDEFKQSVRDIAAQGQ